MDSRAATDFTRRLAWFRGRVEARLRGEQAAHTPRVDRTRDAALRALDTARDAALRALLALDAAQLDFAWACACAAADPLLHAPLVATGGPDARRGLSLATYAALVGDPDVAGLAAWLAREPLIVRLGLLAPALDGLLPGSTPYRAAARLVGYLAGSDELDPAIERVGGLIAVPEPLQLAHAHATVVDRLVEELERGEPALLVVVGPRGAGRRTAVAAAAAQLGRRGVSIDCGRALPAELPELVVALQREAVLLEAVPVLANADHAATGEHRGEHSRRLGRAIDDLVRPWVVTTNDPGFEVPVARPVVRLELRAPAPGARAAMWRNAMAGAVDTAVVQELAMRYPLGPGAIFSAAAAARRTTNGQPDRTALVAGVRSSLAERFGGLADRLEVTDRWDDAVLPAETRDQIDALVARARHAYTVYEEWRFPRTTARGGGVAALFSGPPGTGKTLVAGIIAAELDRDLFRVDLSRVVSKWVGETEKQLSELFDAAEASDALLLFDEADSLFARRTEVKSSSDRYANLEVNYLLQRIETFAGITILTTNLDTSIDAALRRRLSAHIVFWPPEHAERVRLWRRFASCAAPVQGALDFEDLAAEFPDMTGANIRNASLAAAFLAAAAERPISQELLERAARSEYRAMGRVLGRK